MGWEVFFGSLLPLFWLGQALEHMLLAGSVEGKQGGRERGGEGGRKGTRVWEEGDRRGGGVVCSS